MTQSSALASFMAGARDTVPMLVGAAPFGMIFGALVGTTQLAPWQGQLMSLSVFAGSSQFVAIGLMAGLAGAMVIWFATFIAIIVPMVLAPHGQGLELSWRNPQMVAALVAVAVCTVTRHQLLTIMAALTVFFGWQFFYG